MNRVGSLVLLAFLLAGCSHFDPKELSPVHSAAALQARDLKGVEVLEFVRTNLPNVPTEWPPSRWTFEELTLVGLYYHPSLDVARAQWAAATGATRTAGARPNPVASVIPGYNFTSVSSGPGALASPWFPSVSLDLPVETAGKRGYRRSRAEFAAESSRFALAQSAWQVRNSVRSALLEVAYQEARLKEVTEQASVETRIVEVTQQRLEAGAVGVLEVSQRRVAADRARLEVAETRRLTALARAKLAAALSLPAGALAAVEFDFTLEPGPEAGATLLEPSLRDAALLGRADVLGALADYAASQSALQLEIARQYPDLHLGTGYQYDQGDHKWSLSLTVELPVLNQNQGPIAEARARREEAQARFVGVQVQVLAQIEQALTNRALALAGLEEATALERSESEAVRAAENSLKAGGADLLEVLTARQEQVAGRLARMDAAYRTQQALGQLEESVQRPFAGLTSIETSPRLSSSTP